ncbi:Probable phospholipid ABC transporter-binding protein mlaD [Anaerobiospirillum thomasii]|uniref:Probable phospholipid ABC transporter-binding protein mlaD n=1 Tax=Anaerobiospirillum thomasii TaxID=179995 RepID=A0A2X0VRX1_9GAMM|nr:outer membrane lipid asymmetry maintenance protein MlaD [Anaerobiospirillum thomasii]SPT69100.1 Probable phospholipid ABC transporter-binding protein mlaD [Anaerobiospirillum thomasii]SPT72348.1 Probable phospholipid ABC transporter-binding protein mlaD [Anaerobiospirillum thomasii]
MKFSKIEFGVGLFMILGIVASVIMALKVAGLVLDSSSDTYTVKAKFENIGSLKLRAPVKIGGVVIGRVSAITLDKKELVPVVEMSIESRFNELSDESKASIVTAGIIGEQYISITPGFYDEDLGSEYLKEGDFIRDTGSAVVLEELIAKFLYNSSSEDKSEDKSEK